MPCQFGDAVAIRPLPFPFVALLAAVLAAAFLMSSVPVAAQAPESKEPPPPTDVAPKPFEESVLRRIFPEPQSSLLTLSPQLPAGGVPWLRRIPGVAEEMNSLTPFLRDTSLNVHFRTFYFDRLNSNGTTNEAWAFGGWLAYKSGWLADTFAIGAVGYTSQPLYAPDDTPGTTLLHPPQDSLLMVGQAYAQLRYKDYVLVTGGRQIDDEGYLNPNDSRMIPNTFEAVTATGKLGPIGYEVGYFWTMKDRDENDFHNMATQAGVTSGENRGLVLTRLSAEPIQGLKLYGANYLVPGAPKIAWRPSPRSSPQRLRRREWRAGAPGIPPHPELRAAAAVTPALCRQCEEKPHESNADESRAGRSPVLHRRGAARSLVQAGPRRPDLGRQA